MALIYVLIDFENVQPTAAELSLLRGPDIHVRLFHGPHQNKFDADVVKALQPLGTQVEYVQCDRKGKNALDFRIAFVLGRLVQEREGAVSPERRAATFMVVSKDGGFDELLDHLRSLGYRAVRAANIAEALGVEAPSIDVAPPAPQAPPKTPVASLRAAASAPADGTGASVPPKIASKGPGQSTPATIPASAPKPSINAAAKPAANDDLAKAIANLRDHPRNRPKTPAGLLRHLKTLLGKDATDAKVQSLRDRLCHLGLAKAVDGKIEYRLLEDSGKAAA